MMTVRYSPINKVRCFNPFGSFFRHDVQDAKEEKDNGSTVSWYPAADIYDEKDNYVLKLEIPGLAKEDVKIEVENDTLSVSGERKQDNEVKEEDYHWTERRSGKFYRAFKLPNRVDAKKINASLKNGLLELRVPKPEEQKSRNIPITVH